MCRVCAERGIIGFEYRSAAAIGSFPLIHVVSGVDPVTRRPKIARGVIAIGGIAVGGLAIGGAAIGFAYAVGGAAFAPAVIDGLRCDEAAREFVTRWVGSGLLPPSCR